MYEEPLLLLRQEVQEPVWLKKIAPTYNDYMGVVFERVCKEYLLAKNRKGELPILFTDIGRWWGTDAVSHNQVEIDLIAGEGKDYLMCECKWRNELVDLSVLQELRLCFFIFVRFSQISSN